MQANSNRIYLRENLQKLRAVLKSTGLCAPEIGAFMRRLGSPDSDPSGNEVDNQGSTDYSQLDSTFTPANLNACHLLIVYSAQNG
jgi:hypothetical protein